MCLVGCNHDASHPARIADAKPRKGKPAEKRGRTTTGLKLKGQDSRVTEGSAIYAFGIFPEGVLFGSNKAREADRPMRWVVRWRETTEGWDAFRFIDRHPGI